MDSQTTLIIGISLVVLLGLIGSWAIWKGVKKHRGRKLQEKFGVEYDTARQRYGKQAEAQLEERIKRVQGLPLRPLTQEQCDRFQAVWRGAMNRFIDDPALAIAESDRLVKDVMETQGYPIDAFDRRVEYISVDHPRVAQNYRLAHAVAKKTKVGQATTEEMREAMIHYRAVFQELLLVPTPELQEVHA